MEYIYGSTEFKYHNTCVTLGKFDGLHRGHQYLLSELAKFEQQGLTSVMFTFDYHPGNLFSEKEIDLIYTEEEKKELLSRLGPKVLISYPFTEETASMEPEDFIKEVLIGKLDAKAIVIGTDYRFGRKRKGDAAMLKEYSDLYGYKLVICEKLTYHDKVISSTRIREELKNGQMESVNEMLGHPYTIMGTVVTGNKIGRTIGVPTVNLLPATHKLLPPNGVYASSIKFQGNTYYGVTNIGYKPTVGAGQSLGVETHIFGFTGDLYGKSIEVELYRYERPETKFNSVEELKQKVQQDIENVKDFFANQKGLM